VIQYGMSSSSGVATSVSELLYPCYFTLLYYTLLTFGPIAAEIGSGVWGTIANFNRFRVLASLLQQRRTPEANQTLHDVLAVSSVGTLYIQGGPKNLSPLLCTP